MFIRLALALVGATSAAAALLTATADASEPSPASPGITTVADDDGPGWLTPQSVRGVGNFTLHGPGIDGDQVTFRIHGGTARTGFTDGSFSYRHHSPAEADSPAWTSTGSGRVTCLKVVGNSALLTTVVTHEQLPDGAGELGPHAFYLKITDGPKDTVTFFQGPPPIATEEPWKTSGCEDPNSVPWLPGEPNHEVLESGNWNLSGPSA